MRSNFFLNYIMVLKYMNILINKFILSYFIKIIGDIKIYLIKPKGILQM